MKLAILIAVAVLGIALPLFWIVGTLASYVHFYRRRAQAREVPSAVFHPALGVTMADGGETVAKDGKGKRH